MMHASFDRPGPKAISLSPIAHRDRAVLMPRHQPIGLLRFVEQHRSNRASGGSQDRGSQSANATLRAQQFLKRRVTEETNAGTICRHAFGDSQKLAHRLRWKHRLKVFSADFVEGRGEP